MIAWTDIDVRYGSLADFPAHTRDVRLVPEADIEVLYIAEPTVAQREFQKAYGYNEARPPAHATGRPLIRAPRFDSGRGLQYLGRTTTSVQARPISSSRRGVAQLNLAPPR